MSLGLPDLGDGVGLRSPHFGHLLGTPPGAWGVDWFEVVTENFFDDHGFASHVLDHVASHRPVVMHGVALNIGGSDPLDERYLDRLVALADRLRPAWISDHLCWTGVAGTNSHDLLPLPYTHASLAHVADRVRAVQDRLGRPLVLENPSTYLEFQSSELPEWEFLALLADETGCGLLLDVNNVHVAAFNHGFDPAIYIDALPAEHIVQIHVAGHSLHDTHLLDTHDQPVSGAVWSLYAQAQRHTGGTPTLLEWDANIPPFADLVAELAKAKSARAATAVPVTGSAVMTGVAATTAARNGVPPANPAGEGRDRGRGPDLARLQRLLLAACTSARAPAGEHSDMAWVPGAAAPPVALRSCPRRTATASVAIYARGYRSRLLQCLRDQYPALRALVDDQVFDLFATAYIEDQPPATPSLFDYGAGFPLYLEQTRPPGPATHADAVPAALARLERARLEAGRDQGVETDPAHHPIDTVAVLTVAPALRVRTPANLRMLRLEFDLTATVAAADAGSFPPLPEVLPTYYAVARNRYRVHTHVLTPARFSFLAACAPGGAPIAVAAAVGAATEGNGVDAAALWADLFAWLPAAVDAGMVTAT